MAFKVPKKLPTFADLKGILAQDKKSDNSIYQTIQEIIERLTQYTNITNEKLAALIEAVLGNPNGVGGIANATYLTTGDESVALPHSVQLLAGTGITFDDSVAGERTIIASGGGYYDTPLTDGDPDETDLIFADGDCIIVQVPNP